MIKEMLDQEVRDTIMKGKIIGYLVVLAMILAFR